MIITQTQTQTQYKLSLTTFKSKINLELFDNVKKARNFFFIKNDIIVTIGRNYYQIVTTNVKYFLI